MSRKIKLTLLTCLILLMNALMFTACDMISPLLPTFTPSNSDEPTTPSADHQNSILCKHDDPSQITVIKGVAPTCQETGLTQGTQCQRCGTMVVPQSIVPMVDCYESDWIVDKKTTVSEEGHWHTECTMCKKIFQEETSHGTLGLNYRLDHGESGKTYTVIKSPRVDNESEIIIPAYHNGIPVTRIDEWAFYEYTNLTSIILPNTITSIGDFAFWGCKKLDGITIPNSVTSIGGDAFGSCSSLKSIILPDSVTKISGHMFQKCSNLKSVTLGSGVTSIGGYAFADCINLDSITFPNTVTKIGMCAFCNCTSLTSLIIPGSVAELGTDAFSGCSSLKNVIVGDISANVNIAFSGCNSLESITIPCTREGLRPINFSNSLKTVIITGGESIYHSAFALCTYLENVTIPDTVTSIGMNSFLGCSSLTTIAIPKNVTNIYPYAFSFCTNLKSIIFKGTVDEWNHISLGEGWNNKVPATEVICSDGVVSLN